MEYTRDDWTLLRTLPTLCQVAGVGPEDLRRVVVKELFDNALDVDEYARFGTTEDGGYYVQDNGPGFAGTPEEIARRFSMSRPLASSKLERKPSRGALGNGLRVVAGAVYVSGGRLTVWTRNQCLRLTPLEDGTTAVEVEPIDFPTGTRVMVWLGPTIPEDDDCLLDATNADFLACGESSYRGKTSPHWYDPATFRELIKASEDEPVRSFVSRLDGCSGARAGQVSTTFKNRMIHSLTQDETTSLLVISQSLAPKVNPERLGFVGKRPGWCKPASAIGHFTVNGIELPYVIEAWAKPAESNLAIAFVNRTTINDGQMAFRPTGAGKVDRWLYGLGINKTISVGRDPVQVAINIQVPYMPITSQGKRADFSPFSKAIASVVAKAAKRAKQLKQGDTAKPTSQKDAIIAYLDEAIAIASDNGEYRYALRQLYYIMRPRIMVTCGLEGLKYGTFCNIIADYERENGALPGIYRDSRGTLYQPHGGGEIQIGTLTVEQYERPAWTFNKVLYSEKEGFFSMLRAAGWPEQHDCALLTSKGHASGAAKDIIDFLAESDEPITVFCIHDADAYGTTIFEALQNETRARPGRKIEIKNFGLEPSEALSMGLQSEDMEPVNGRRPVGKYVELYWAEWLQKNRVELNAMTSPQLIDWLNAKIAPYEEIHGGKVVPPGEVLRVRLGEETEKALQDAIRERILREAGFEDQVRQAYVRVVPALDEIGDQHLGNVVIDGLEEDAARHWSHPVVATAKHVVSRFGYSIEDEGGESEEDE